MKKLVISIVVLAILGAAGYGGWWYAADRGLIAGRTNSPRPENFKATLDRYIAQTARGYYSQACVSMNVPQSGPQAGGFKDMRPDYTPVGFRFTPDARNDPSGTTKQKLAYLEKQGFFEAKPDASGNVSYNMTWKGFAATNNNGCFYMASAERTSKIIGFEKTRTDNGIDIYQVTASSAPKSMEPWAQTPEFKNLFPQHTGMLRMINPEPVIYEMARGESGFTVIKERDQPARTQPSENVAMTMKLVGTLTPDRVKAAAQSYIARMQETSNISKMCLPELNPGDVDQVTPDNRSAYQAPTDKPVTADIYNLPGRDARDNDAKMRGYVLLRRLESLGLAKSEQLNYSEFNGMPAFGGIRFELNKELIGKYTTPRSCYLLGSLEVEEIIRLNQFTETGQNPSFVARMAFKPIDENAKRIVAEFGHFSRVAEVGLAMTGTLTYKDSEVQVAHAEIRMPPFIPDVSETKLPAILTGLTRPPGAVIGGAAAPAYGSRPAPAPSPGGSYATPAPGSTIVHAVGVYQGMIPAGAQRGPGNNPEGTVNVVVVPSRGPAVLYLTAYDPVNWVVQIRPGARITQVVTSGYHPQRVTLLGASGIRVTTIPYRGDYADPSATINRIFGVKPASLQQKYNGTTFEVGR